MKEGMTYKRLGDVATTLRGLTYKSGDEVDYSSKVVLRSNNIDLATHQLNFDEIRYLREDFVIPADKYVRKNSIFICMSNGSKQHLGKVAFIDKDYGYAFGGFMGLVVPLDGVLPKYVYYAMFSPSFKESVLKEGKGANINNLRFTEVEDFRIPIPSFEEQEHIVSELDQLSFIIADKQEQLRELDNLAQAIFYEMFGDPLTNTEGWDVKKLGDVTTKCGCISWKKVEESVQFKYIDLSAVNRDNFRIENPQLISAQSAPSRAKQIVASGDVLFGTTRPMLRRVCIVPSSLDNQICSTGFCVLRPKECISSEWLFQLLRSSHFYEFIEPLQTGANYPAVSDTIVKSYAAAIPPMSLQQAYVQKVKVIEEQKETILKSIVEFEDLLAQRMEFHFA